MKKELLILSTIVLLLCCGETKKEKTLLSENTTVKPGSTFINSTSEKDSLKKLMKFREESLNSEYKNYYCCPIKNIIIENRPVAV